MHDENNFVLNKNFVNKYAIIDNDKFILFIEAIEELKWLILVPKVAGAKNILDLNEQQYIFYNDKILQITKILNEVFMPDQINIASLGNITPQLHFHIILRYKNDKFWPKSPFDFPKKYIEDKNIISQMVNEFKKIFIKFI